MGLAAGLVLSCQFSVLSSEFSVLSSELSVLSCRFARYPLPVACFEFSRLESQCFPYFYCTELGGVNVFFFLWA